MCVCVCVREWCVWEPARYSNPQEDRRWGNTLGAELKAEKQKTKGWFFWNMRVRRQNEIVGFDLLLAFLDWFPVRLCNSPQKTSANTPSQHSHSGWMNVIHHHISQTLKFTKQNICIMQHVKCVIELWGDKCTQTLIWHGYKDSITTIKHNTQLLKHTHTHRHTHMIVSMNCGDFP